MDIVLSTLNAKYIHSAFGLRYLRANLGALRERSVIREFTISERPVDIVEAILKETPRIVGLSVAIWNAVETLEVVRLLRRVAPSVKVVLGGPEISHETNEQELASLADVVVTGEGEGVFVSLCERLLSGAPVEHVVAGGLPELSKLVLPYSEYTADDVAHRIIYVEASRGCPFKCEFCLSSLDEKVRGFPLDVFLGELDGLIQRGARQFKFVDRTFNLKPTTSDAILRFFLERQHLGVFAHFELVPDRFPDGLKALTAQFPPGALQFEVGVQTLNPQTSQHISRKLDVAALEKNLTFLNTTGVHVHTDLIVGLPGEDVASFARGFDHLVSLGPHEIQVGILKRLRGTPIVRHDAEFAVVWSPSPPYEILSNRLIDFPTMQRMKRFARVWDLFANRGHFERAMPLLWKATSPFEAVMRFTDWVAARASLGGISLTRQRKFLIEFLVESGVEREQAEKACAPVEVLTTTVPARQAMHLASRERGAAG